MSLSNQQLHRLNDILDTELCDVYLDNLQLTHTNEVLKDANIEQEHIICELRRQLRKRNDH